MKIAIPMQQDLVSNHFTRADKFVILDPSGRALAEFENPALSQGCSGKQLILTQCLALEIDTLLIRNIGQNMLSRLLRHGLTIWQLHRNQSLETIRSQLEDITQIATQLTDVSQGRPSIKAIHRMPSDHQRCCQHQGQAHGQGHCHEHAKSDAECHSKGQGHHCCRHQHQE
ncbi:NifB/NifX family molybdenum-iron cluster-binding protein [Celerinatantimonas sp. YJH-8]|uniref:NifB/NifX family molybdenum-iron cluster-binding protein n=1 Tax=Celerinatantimonas sp. YJH-8 TaxID=3228714 RepID=UPI0038C23579